jgi:prepilin-type N-terminal cleavage/methylation domain-containing protein
MSARRRPGLTLIELLVALMVFALLLALLAPGLYHAREAARRTQCRDHMKQLGIAMQNYHDGHGLFPPGIISNGAGETGVNDRFVARRRECERPGEASPSGLTLILPFMEQLETYNAYNFKLACCSMENATAVTTPIETFV